MKKLWGRSFLSPPKPLSLFNPILTQFFMFSGHKNINILNAPPVEYLYVQTQIKYVKNCQWHIHHGSVLALPCCHQLPTATTIAPRLSPNSLDIHLGPKLWRCGSLWSYCSHLVPMLGFAVAGSLDWGAPMAPIKKLRDGGIQVLGDRHFVNKHNNQPKVSCSGGGGVSPNQGWSYGEDFFLLFSAASGATKNSEKDHASVCGYH